MTIFFDSTVSGTTANSYSSVTGYNQYRENMGLALLSESDAQIGMIRASSWLDNHYRSLWSTNTKTVSGQALHWPQSGAVDYDGESIPDNEIPRQVLQAVYEFDIRMKAMGKSSLDPQEDTNTKAEKLEGLGSSEYFSQRPVGSLSDTFSFIDEILSGLINSSSGGFRLLDLERG